MAVIDTKFRVTGGETKNPPSNAINPSQREINISAPFGVPSADQWSGQKVWLLLPGFTNPADYYDPNLAAAIRDANPNDTVLALDWTQVSGTKFFNIGPLGIAAGDLYRSGSWITPVATAVRDKLVEWGMPAAALNIVGNSLGANLASDLAASFNTYGSQVSSVTALDPASNKAKRVSPYDKINGFDTDLSNGYVLDGNGGIADPIKRLDFGGAAVSRSFNGISSLAGNEDQAGTAKESFLFDFGTDPNNIADQIAQHNGVVTAYTNLVTTDAGGNSRLATNILGLSDTRADHQFRPNFYKGDFNVSPQVHEGVIPVDAQNNPLFLVAAKLDGGINDRIIYGTNGNDELRGIGIFGKYYNNNGNNTYYVGNGDDFVLTGTGNDTVYGGAGADILVSGDGNNLILGEEGNDILSAGIGNDTISGGAGDDNIHGGDGRNTIRGDEGNDYLTGGNGVNILFGGLGNDILEGGAGQNILRGSEGNGLSGVEVDTLIGNNGQSLNAFYIGNNTTNWYSVAGGNDYAYIQRFNPDRDVILGGVNIEAQNLITQTFLWSGSELIAKIEGLWASQLESQFPTRIFF
ncbi:MAG: calcium-binding protein [Microcoleus sp.]|uniref:calcium-binding protein n=1 Tax=Microcoleus sp. TaxID=44472 RepID=UPI003C747201